MQLCRPRQRRHRDPRPRLGGYWDAAAAAAGGRDATALAWLLCALLLRRPSGCGPVPQRLPRGKAVNGFCLHWFRWDSQPPLGRPGISLLFIIAAI